MVTAAGQDQLDELTAKLRQTEGQLLTGLADEEAGVLRDLLQRVARRVTGVDGEALVTCDEPRTSLDLRLTSTKVAGHDGKGGTVE